MIDEIMYQLRTVSMRAYKKKDFALVVKIKKLQLDYIMEQKKLDPQDPALWTEDELTKIIDRMEKIPMPK